MQKIVKIRIVMKLKNLSHRLQFTVYRKTDEMNKKTQKFTNKPTGNFFFFINKDVQLVINDKTRTVVNFENFS